MNKLEALHVFATAMVRELLREDEERFAPLPPQAPTVDPNAPPEPRLDFDASNDVCEHGGVFFNRELCPVHGPSVQEDVSAEELDDITSEEVPGPIARARRITEQRLRQAREARQYPEELENMKGMGPPEPVP